MGEPEVEPFRTLVLCVVDVVDLLFSRQLRPSLLAALILPDVVILDDHEQHDIEAANPEKDLVSSLICTKLLVPFLSPTTKQQTYERKSLHSGLSSSR